MISAFTIVLCLVGMLLQLSLIYAEYKKKMVAAVWLKGLAAAVFVCVGFLGLKSAGKSRFADTVVTGLLLGAIGDVLLNLRYLTKKLEQLFFMAGIASFFLGHVMYLVSLIPFSEHLPVLIIAGLAVTAILMAVILPKITASTVFKGFGTVYVLTVVFMATVAVGNLISVRNTNRTIFAIGALFFLISDIILIFNTFGPDFSMRLSAATLILYYIGQSLIACSVYFHP